jgi:AGCS family alanine or glycine:cation symporter
VDEWIESWVGPAAEALSAVVFFEVPLFGVGVPVVVAWLVGGAVFFTIALRGINLRGLPTSLAVLRGDHDRDDAPGEVSHAQALATALSGTVGIGNIGGVAVAVVAGGPGATLWMILAGLLGMATKCAECTLAVRYRQVHPDGTVSGGPMQTLARGLADRGLPRLGRALGGFYALGIVIGCLGIGNMFQANQAFAQFVVVTGGEASFVADQGWLFGAALAVVVGGVTLGGIRSIAKVAALLVPAMGGLYFVGALAVIGWNAEYLPGAMAAIVQGAFAPEGVAGGALGAMIVGFQRAVFSNEAGIGSAAIAHSAVKTDLPGTEGVVALLEPFVDTVVICTLTALVIGTTAQADPTFLAGEAQGVAMTSAAFAAAFAWAPVPLAVAAMLFAFSTMLSWSYYGLRGATYLLGNTRWVHVGFNLVFCLFIVLGAAIQLDAVLAFSDAMVFVLCIPNLIGLFLLTPVIREELARLAL